MQRSCGGSPAPSTYRDWLSAGRTGVHHVGVRVHDMEASRRMLLDQGGAVMHEALLPGGAHAVYVEMGEAVPIIELIRLDPKFDALFGYIRRMAADWDGSEPVRAISPESEWVRKTDG